MRTYAVDTANWWLDKLTAKSATTSVTWDAAQHALPSGTANPLRTVSSSYVWNADRTLSTETVQAGVALQQRVTAYTYPSSNNYGLPTGVAVSADSDAEDANSVVTKAAYNSIGQRTSVSDPNQGGWGFAYNGLGEVLAQTDARGISTQLTYDVLGRPKTRTATVDVTGDNVADTVNDGWTYDAANAKGAPEVAQRTINGVLERSSTHFYDTLARPVLTYFAQQTGTGIQGYNQGTKYDSYYGRPVGQEYPNGEAVQVLYSSYGDAIAEKEPVSGVEYRRSTGVNARGQATQEVFGNGVTLTPTYQVQTGQLTGLTYANTGGTLRQLGYGYDVFGNLKRQSLGGGASREDYSYDQLHRLVQSIRSGAASGTVNYGFDAVGNLTKKSDFSSNTANAYGYTGGSCGGGANAVKSIALAAGGTRTYCYDANGNLTGDNAGLSLKYDHQNLPVVAQRGALRDDFRYGTDGMRTRSWGSDGARVYLPGYEHRTDTGETKVYIGDYAVISRIGASRKVEYLLKDRLGSVDAVSNSSGAVTETRGYDAFGKPRSGTWNDLSPAKIASTAVTPKGFTQHEHLNELELIHMNGRMYDYNVGRFMGVDPFIQFPLNSQSLNPYSYILNNPLSGTDPTGYKSVPQEHVAGSICNTSSCTSSTVMSSGNKQEKIAKPGEQGKSRAVASNGANPGQDEKPEEQPAVHDILSDMQREPSDADGKIAPKSLFSGTGVEYTFPIENIVVLPVQDTVILLGFFTIDGTAAEEAAEAMSETFNTSGITTNGIKYQVRFRFDVVESKGNVHANWMTDAQVQNYASEFSRTQGRTVSSNDVVALTRLGSNSMLFNPLYKTSASIQRGLGVSSSDASDIYRYVRGSFAHEFSHAGGFRHSLNATDSMSSYSLTRHVTGDDFRKWCGLKEGENAC